MPHPTIQDDAAAAPAADYASPAAPRPERAEALRKAELEAAMLAAPDDTALRDAYLDHLLGMAARSSGLACALLPGRPPLFFRGGTPDITVLSHVLREQPYAVPMRATPQRILVIGAHAGYAAVDLVRRHPRARVLCAEPLADNMRVLSLNTTPYRRILVAQTALWHSATRLAPYGRLQGDWSVRLVDEALDADRVVPAMTVGELLARAGFGHADMIVCDASGAEREVFADPMAAWLRFVDVALVRIHEGLASGAGARVAACFPAEEFEHGTHGDMALFLRRVPRTALPPGPAEHTLLSAGPDPAPFAVQDVAPYAWAFFVFDGTSCQLHPNPPGDPPARVAFPVMLDGYRKLVSGLHHAGQPRAEPVVFTARIEAPDGSVLAQDAALVRYRETGRLEVDLPSGLRGPGRAVLLTQMAPGAPHNQLAWARFIEPKLI